MTGKKPKYINKFQIGVKCIENSTVLEVQSVGKQSGSYIISPLLPTPKLMTEFFLATTAFS